jgi:hypothetical protein
MHGLLYGNEPRAVVAVEAEVEIREVAARIEGDGADHGREGARLEDVGDRLARILAAAAAMTAISIAAWAGST